MDTGESHEKPAETVPETIAWVKVGEERVPVVRVEMRRRGETAREIAKYAADGRLLETTVQVKPPR